MNERVKKLWIEALRSGEYQQGTNWLKSTEQGNDSYCCLGVLCELFRVETGQGEWIEQDKFWFEFDVNGSNSAAVLPAPVMTWAGIGDRNPLLGRTKAASNLNDTGKSFNYIADRIEKYL